MRSPPRRHPGPARSVLAEAVRRSRGAFGVVGVFSFALNLLALASPLYMLQVYNRVLSSGRVETLVMLTVMVAVALMAYAALDALRTAVTVRIGAWLNRALGPHYLDSGVRARLAGDGSGGQAFRDLGQLQSFIATSGMTAFFDMPWTPLFIAVIWLLHPWLGMLALSAVLLLFAISVANEFCTKRALAAANDGQLASAKLAEATVRNADAVFAMGMGGALSRRWSDLAASTEDDLLRASRRGGLASGAGKFLRMFFQSAILGLGALLAVRGEATPGVMIAASILLGRALAPVDVAISAWKNFASARLAYGRLSSQAEAFPPEVRRTSLPAPRGGLALADVTVLGPAGPILRRVSFAAEPGEALAVIGPSAAGKSTLCKVIVGLQVPQSGTVRLDGTDMSLWNRDELGPHIGYLPQDGGLFAGTVRENIARMQDAPDAKIVEAAQRAHAHDMITRLPQGYDTLLGEGGSGLSGGQRQRIGLARALFSLPPLVVLDEPNANLDQAGESALAEAILELKQHGSTLVIVGHRPSTLAQADKVLLLRDGAVQAFGPRAEILGRMRTAAEAKAAASAAPAPPAAESQGAPGWTPAGTPDEGPTLKLGPWRVASSDAQT